jgi:ribose/xylose/arabinose/galactoside ABC-type transport system permease subunit
MGSPETTEMVSGRDGAVSAVVEGSHPDADGFAVDASRQRQFRVLVSGTRRYGLQAAFVLVFIYLLVASPAFRSTTNLLNLLQQNAIIGIVACGMLVMIVSGGFDLSVGAVGATASVLAARLSGELSVPLVILAALALGAAAGTINGLLVSRLRINPFVTTLGMSSVISGLLFVATNAQPVPLAGGTGTFYALGLGHVWKIPADFVLFLVCAGLVWALLRLTRFGHYIYAVGGNEEASRLSGIPVASVKLMAYMIGGVLAGLAGVVLLGQTDIGQPSAATTWPLSAIAICVVGGAALNGGSGSIPGTVLGTMLLGVVSNGLDQLNVSPYWVPAVTGAVVIAAVGVAALGRRE